MCSVVMMDACCSRFTAAEGGARLAAAASTKNILAVEYASFIPVRLLYEKAHQIRGSLFEGSKRSIYITRASRVQVVAFELKILTDLGTVAAQTYDEVYDWMAELETKEVVICTSAVLKRILEEELLSMSNINVLIVDSCHLIYKDEDLKYIMRTYKECSKTDQPIILALTYPLFNSKKDTEDKKETAEQSEKEKETSEQSEKEKEDTTSISEKEKEDTTSLSEKEKENTVSLSEKEKENTVSLREKEITDDSMTPSSEGVSETEHRVFERVKGTEIEEIGVYKNLDDFDMYEKLEWKIEELEKELCCQMDLAEDIDGGKRMSASVSKPRELIIEYDGKPTEDQLPEVYRDLDNYMRDTVQDALDFIEDHRHDPTEIYGDELYDEFMSIPDPTIDPKMVFKKFLYVLEQLGPYAADKAAFCLLNKLEKLKIKIPYERHFILMCLCTTVFVKIRCYAELVFNTIEDEWIRIKTFSTPKILRFVEILEKFKPPDAKNSTGIRQECDGVAIKSDCDSKDDINHAKNKENNVKKLLKDIESMQRNNAARALQMQQNPDALCGIVFMKEPLIAKIMFMVIVDMSRCNPSLSYVCVQFCATESPADPGTEPRECLRQGKRQEDVLKKFRMHECNLLLATSALEEGIDLPRCNLVLRWDVPPSYRSYGLCRGRARAPRAAAGLLCSDSSDTTDLLLHHVATYRELDQIISRKCGCGIQDEPPQTEEDHADAFTTFVKPYSPNDNKNTNTNTEKGQNEESFASVDLSTAIALINRYCGKLPSDTFTRLAPQWWMEEVALPVQGTGQVRPAYICTLRLPLNCPVKYNIVGHPMPTKVLARRMVALQACRILHKSGELDNQLMPIGKENFRAVELEGVNNLGACTGNEPADAHDSARPGTTKRRQYYYKRTAWAFTDCQPVIDSTDAEIYPGKRNMLYAIVSKLWCALPERYNTRGRRLHAPQLASQAIGILMARQEPDNLQIPAFPVYTRSGEVRVSVEHVPGADVRVSPRRGKLIRRFMRFVFAEVLRVRRRGMKLQSEGSTHNNYYIVPTIKTVTPDGTHKIDIDWDFLELIYQHTEEKKASDLEKPVLWQEMPDDDKGETFVFDAEKYKEAVVTPWYRNQDQPQFFLVAEICWNLTPDSSFPSATHQSFRDYYSTKWGIIYPDYYSTKYGVTLTQRDQPLLDVDHTSARLNLLTPRYVNRKGVALPVSSERTRRAKRDRLDQKQILVPELCRLHPFAAPLWFATVALPCVLYRINALLIADEIRRAVAIDVGLGIPKINDHTMPGFQWPALDFGWSLAEVLSADSEKNDKKKDEEDSKKEKELKDSESSSEKEKTEADSQKSTEEDTGLEDDSPPAEKTINDILQEKEDAEADAAFEIGTWSNDMASSIPETSEYDELMEPLPPNLTFCTSASGGTNWCDPVSKPKYNQYGASKNFSMADSDDSFMSSDLDSDDTDLDYEGSDEDADANGFCSSRNANTTMGVRIEYKTAHEAEAFDIERTKKVNPAPMPDEEDDARDRALHDELIRQGSAPEEYIEKFRSAVTQHKQDIIDKNQLITKDDDITEILPETKETYHSSIICKKSETQAIDELFPYTTDELEFKDGQITIESIERNKRVLLAQLKEKLPSYQLNKLNCFSMKDINIDSKDYVNEKVVNVGFDTKEGYKGVCKGVGEFIPYYTDGRGGKEFDFDFQPVLEGHPGPSPSVILQALTMSNANDGINLERLETIGDSFLKFAITAYLYCAHPTVHEGKLSHMRSKQVSNLNLYRLGRNKRLGARMIASKFEPHDNWLPPCHKPPPTLHPRLNGEGKDMMQHLETPLDAAGCFIPYNLITQHSIPDKSIADCVEALIGAYLLECGPRGALLFMSWLGIRVLPCHHVELDDNHPFVSRAQKVERENQPIFGELRAPPSPLLRYIEDPEGELEQMLSGYDALERTLQYRFQDRSLLLQALTHASHHSNRLTDCYQRLEFLGDAILDYLITRHLYEDPRRHSPGALTDLRSALVNNTIFATLAARHGFHKYFRHMSPGLNEVLTKYVKIQEENGHSISEEHYLIQEDAMEQAEDVEVPKALGDLFESVAGAIFLDSGMSLGAVWKSYVNLMGAELEAFSAAAPKSPVRELLEAEPDTAKFGKPERLADGRRVRVCVEVFGRGTFKGVGRNYRIAKGTAARCALRHLKVHRAR
uniref:Dicer-1-PA n=1 Tax=Spodoptera frugiperda TaxID=7108 RepID=A0A2P1DMA2_SPOFR|nr:Dicer-1-PA [Spodoptera frugiperda]